MIAGVGSVLAARLSEDPGAWTGGRRVFAPRGKTLGGSISINGHIYNRGQRTDFDTWA